MIVVVVGAGGWTINCMCRSVDVDDTMIAQYRNMLLGNL